MTASAAGLRVLSALGIEAITAAGQSLAELTALHWAGAMDEETLLRAAATRGRVVADAGDCSPMLTMRRSRPGSPTR